MVSAMAVQALRSVPDGRRAELAEAISEATAAKTIEDAAVAAVGRAQASADGARTRLAAAKADIDRAREETAERLAEAARTGETAAPDLSTHDARQRALNVADELDAAKVAVAACQVSAADADYVAGKARKKLRAAAGAVLASDAKRMLAEAIACQNDLIARRLGLRFLVHELEIVDPEITSFLRNEYELPGTWGNIHYHNWSRHPASARWQAALDGLMADADAALPAS